MTRIAVILGSVRPHRAGAQVADWVVARANTVEGVRAELVDLDAFHLPAFAEELPPMMAPAEDPAAVAWNEALAGFDAYIIVTPEYNHSIPGALKNAIDFITPSVLAGKAVGLVGYSYSAGHRPIEHLRSILANFTTASSAPRSTSTSPPTSPEAISPPPPSMTARFPPWSRPLSPRTGPWPLCADIR